MSSRQPNGNRPASRNRPPAPKATRPSATSARARGDVRGYRGAAPTVGGSRNRLFLAIGGMVAALVVVVAAWAIATGGSGGGTPAPVGTLVQGRGGQWTNISVDRLATMLKAKDFTFLNVKTPYIGEIDGTDLYIPYTDLAARKAELPSDKTAKIVVYCRSGNESAIASQTLLDLGYSSILNLDGGMNAWTASGRALVQKPRT